MFLVAYTRVTTRVRRLAGKLGNGLAMILMVWTWLPPWSMARLWVLLAIETFVLLSPLSKVRIRLICLFR